MTSPWQPYRESLRATLLRTGLIALGVGLVLARGVERLPLGVLIALWPSFGGHWVELWFLNWLRPRLPAARAAQAGARLALWFVAGVMFALCIEMMVKALGGGPPRGPIWWVGGIGFIGVELIAHLALRIFGRPSFYDGRG